MGHWEAGALALVEWPLGYHPCDIGILTCAFESRRGTLSVSYTHLDVYKRQARPVTGEKQGNPLFCKEIGKNLSKSVDKEAGVWYYI